MGALSRLSSHRPILLRQPRHTGEHVWVEPLAAFLQRKIWVRPENRQPLDPRDGVRQVGAADYAPPPVES